MDWAKTTARWDEKHLSSGIRCNLHYCDAIMGTVASQITSLTIVYTTVYSDADQRKHQSSASLAFVWGIHRVRWSPRTKGQLRGKCFHLMTSSWYQGFHGITLKILVICKNNWQVITKNRFPLRPCFYIQISYRLTDCLVRRVRVWIRTKMKRKFAPKRVAKL